MLLAVIAGTSFGDAATAKLLNGLRRLTIAGVACDHRNEAPPCLSLDRYSALRLCRIIAR